MHEVLLWWAPEAHEPACFLRRRREAVPPRHIQADRGGRSRAVVGLMPDGRSDGILEGWTRLAQHVHLSSAVSGRSAVDVSTMYSLAVCGLVPWSRRWRAKPRFCCEGPSLPIALPARAGVRPQSPGTPGMRPVSSPLPLVRAPRMRYARLAAQRPNLCALRVCEAPFHP